ncbi:MAG: oxygenase MpaB family protein [Pseudomonadota bacterium]
MSLPAQVTLADLELLRRAADPLADDTIARLLGPWHDDQHGNFEVLGVVSRQMEQWKTNADLAGWRAGPDVDPDVNAALQAYLQAGMALPSWADPERIKRAEALFFDFGMLSCTLLFCSSLPECYVIPDLAAVLHVAGQLEQRTDHRIRATAAMIFPVMMVGGLTDAAGGGLAQVLKVRLIHATIRHLILRGNPSQVGHLARVASQPVEGKPGDLHQALFALGWNIADDGMPCSQDELAYTLLTFGYVFLRSLRKLGLGLPKEDELAYLHTWNVMGHVLGMEATLMAHTMEQAEALFTRLQQRGRLQTYAPDPRPGLGQALMKTMADVIPFHCIKPFPVLLTRHLCGKTTATDIGIAGGVGLFSRLLFVALMLFFRAVDFCVRLVFKEFSICRMITRVVGYQFTCKVLMSQTRPLKLPPALLNQMGAMTRHWHVDPKAPRWLNRVEHYLTKRKASPLEGVKA